MMKKILYLKEWVKFTNIQYKDFTEIDFDSNFYQNNFPNFSFLKYLPASEEIYVQNYGNLLCGIHKTKHTLVLEENDNKISLKFFIYHSNRKPGSQWFKVVKNMYFITVDRKNGYVYEGSLLNYNKKRKCIKKLRRNYFQNDPLNNLELLIRNSVTNSNDPTSGVGIRDFFIKFIDKIVDSNDNQNLKKSEKLFKYYLDKRGYKYPNNFYVYKDHFFGKPIKKIMKKNSLKIVDSFMIHHNLQGKTIKKALHNCKNINIELYKNSKIIFGTDWLNQEEGLVKDLFESKSNFALDLFERFKKNSSSEELKKLFRLFKMSFIYQEFDNITLIDHIRFFLELKRYGESDIKWDLSNYDEKFMEQHLNWSEKLQFYKKGIYKRIYPDFFYRVIERPIKINNSEYIPKLLDDTNSYNEESVFQSNCVRTYIGKANSMIVSLRKKTDDSQIRATLEYRIVLINEKIEFRRIQTKGKFNSEISDDWSPVLEILDNKICQIMNSNNFVFFGIEKECSNGIKLSSSSEWDSKGNLKWTFNNVYDEDSFYYIW